MNKFKKLVDFHFTFENLLGRTNSLFEYRVMVYIGYYESINTPLTVKQLILLDLGPKTSLDRVLNGLVKKGAVIKMDAPKDGRSQHLYLSDASKQQLFEFYDYIEAIVNSSSEHPHLPPNKVV